MELDVSEVKIADLLQNSLVMIKEKALAHSISLDLQIADNINGTKIKGDERRLKQVMFNLLSNSAKFTPDGGAITIVGKKGRKRIRDQCLGHRHWDDSPGTEEDSLKHFTRPVAVLKGRRRGRDLA